MFSNSNGFVINAPFDVPPISMDNEKASRLYIHHSSGMNLADLKCANYIRSDIKT